MNRNVFVGLCAIAGIICGYATIHSPLEHAWESMIFWVIAGLVVLYFSPDKRAAIYAGGTFGFLLIATWLFAGFQGTPDRLPGFLVLTLVMSFLGAVCGSVGAVLFHSLFRKSTKTEDLARQ